MARYKPKNDPFARKLVELRGTLGETMGKFAARFSVGRTTMLNWERHGPPSYGPVRLHAEEVFRKIQKMIKMRQKRARERLNPSEREQHKSWLKQHQRAIKEWEPLLEEERKRNNRK